jgi:hypothetical protein
VRLKYRDNHPKEKTGLIAGVSTYFLSLTRGPE